MSGVDAEDSAAWRVWREAAGSAEIDAALRGLFEAVDAEVAAGGETGGVRCDASGRCCDFGAWGHRLYVTGLEIAWFLGEAANAKPTLVSPPAGVTSRGVSLSVVGQDAVRKVCPYQVGGLCSTHPIRPLGCRIFFCQPGTQAWQNDVYERYLQRLRKLHEEYALPYRYMEWLAGLAEAVEELGTTDHYR